MKMRFALAVLPWFFMTATAIAQHNPSATETGHRHPAPGVSIVHFVQIDEGVYKGSKPKTDADFRFLQSKNIKYILDLKFFPLLYRLEKNKAKRYGMIVIPATINASPISPAENHVNHILCVLADKRLRPIYFHCDVGRDRTSLIATLYEIYFLSLPPQNAWQTMEGFGFKDGWTLRGLKVYLQNHSERSLVRLNCCDTCSETPRGDLAVAPTVAIQLPTRYSGCRSCE
jgi:hypothetical protein